MSKYELLPKQREFIEVHHNNELDVAIYQGGFGSGKTFAGSLLGILLSRKYAGCRGLVGAKDYELLKNTTLISYFEHLEAIGYKENVHYKYNKTDKTIKFKNGSIILFKGLDDPEKIKSLNVHWIEIEEASQIKKTAFDVALSRLRAPIKSNWKNFKYRFFGHTNPEAKKGWIYEVFVEHKKNNFRRVIAPTSENTNLPKHFIETLKETYDEEYYRINVLGEDGDYASGLVVKNFSDANLASLKYCDELPLHLTCDFNVDPMCWYIAHTDSKRAFIIDEIVIENTTTQQTIEEFLRRYPQHKSDIIINGDASGDYRSTQSERTNYKIIEKALLEYGYKKENIKFHLRKFNPPIHNRILAFNAKVKNTNGQIGLYIDKYKCPKLLYNINNLSYKEGTSIIDVPSHHTLKQDRSSKFLMHPYDAVSYLVEYYWAIK